MSIATRIRTKLEERLRPMKLEVLDESGRHAGHAGARDGGETHFQVTVVADAFAGLTRVARQRLVYDTLDAELKERVHALTIKALTPDEARR